MNKITLEMKQKDQLIWDFKILHVKMLSSFKTNHNYSSKSHNKNLWVPRFLELLSEYWMANNMLLTFKVTLHEGS